MLPLQSFFQTLREEYGVSDLVLVKDNANGVSSSCFTAVNTGSSHSRRHAHEHPCWANQSLNELSDHVVEDVHNDDEQIACMNPPTLPQRVASIGLEVNSNSNSKSQITNFAPDMNKTLSFIHDDMSEDDDEEEKQNLNYHTSDQECLWMNGSSERFYAGDNSTTSLSSTDNILPPSAPSRQETMGDEQKQFFSSPFQSQNNIKKELRACLYPPPMPRRASSNESEIVCDTPILEIGSFTVNNTSLIDDDEVEDDDIDEEEERKFHISSIYSSHTSNSSQLMNCDYNDIQVQQKKRNTGGSRIAELPPIAPMRLMSPIGHGQRRKTAFQVY